MKTVDVLKQVIADLKEWTVNNINAAGVGGTEAIALTQAEYDKLGDEKYTDGKIYAITDGGVSLTGADAIGYDNSSSELTADNVQAAIDEIVNDITETSEKIDSVVDEISTNLSGLTLHPCTQEEYDAMESHAANTLYIIRE